jgi:hypothetical protein
MWGWRHSNVCAQELSYSSNGRKETYRGSGAFSMEELAICDIHMHFSVGAFTQEVIDVRTVCLQLKYVGIFTENSEVECDMILWYGEL